MTLDPVDLPRRDTAQAHEYTEAGTWGEATLPDLVEPTLKANPQKQVVGPRNTTTFAQLWDAVKRVSAGLQELGIDRGDVVSYQLPNWMTTAVLHLAAMPVGAVCNPIIPIYRRSSPSVSGLDPRVKAVHSANPREASGSYGRLRLP